MRRSQGQIDLELEQCPWTWANLVTAVRAVSGTAVLVTAGVAGSPTWNYIGLAIYWVLDILDGYLARALDQETRVGAQMDVLSDRLLMALFYVNYLRFEPASAVAVAPFLLCFMVIDQYLSTQYLRWPISSPNYFASVSRRVWALNWSPAGKALNTGLVTVLLIALPSAWPAAVVAVTLIAVKLQSCVALHRLDPPEAGWVLPPRDQIGG